MSDSSVVHAIAGAVAGCASLAVTYPLYASMVRQQVEQKDKLEPTDKESNAASPSSSFRAFLRYITSTSFLHRHFGGLNAALTAVTIQSACYYYFMQWFRNFHRIQQTTPLVNMMLGTEAGIATVLLTNPCWVVNSRQITCRGKPPQRESKNGNDNQTTTSSQRQSAGSVSSTRTLHRRIARAASSEALGLLAEASEPDDDDHHHTIESSPSTVHVSLSPYDDVSMNSSTMQSSSPSHPSADESSVKSPSPSHASSPHSPSSPASVPSSSSSLADLSFFAALRRMLKEEGVGSLYSGVGPALALVSSPALQFACFEAFKIQVQRWRLRSLVASATVLNVASSAHATVPSSSSSTPMPLPLSSVDLFLLGALSKIVATLITYPIQTVKSQLQKDRSPYASMGWIQGCLRCCRDMMHGKQGVGGGGVGGGGVSAFYRGLRAKILQTGLTAAFLFLFREQFLILWATWMKNGGSSSITLLRPVVVKS